jgi:hypothetical protein
MAETQKRKLLVFSKTGEMVKFEDLSNNKGGMWFFIAENVKPFIKKITPGTEVEFQAEERNGQRTVVFLKSSTGYSATQTVPSTGFTCSVCGVPLKDGKYKVCYNCNKNSSGNKTYSNETTVATVTVPTTTFQVNGGNMEDKNRQTSIERQAMMKASADAISRCMQGQLDIEAMKHHIGDLYEYMLNKIN